MGFARKMGEAAFPWLWQGLIGAWCPGLGPSGLKLFDHSGRGHTGTLTNMDPGTDWVIDQGLQALEFDGVNDFVDIGNPVGLRPDSQITLASFFIPTDPQPSAFGRIICKTDGATGDHWGLMVDSQERLRFRVGSIENSSQPVLSFPDELNFGAGTFNGTLHRTYLNGRRFSLSSSGTINTGGDVAIGRNPAAADRFYEGGIVSVFVWDRALNDSAIFDLQRAGPFAPFIPKLGPEREGVKIFMGGPLVNRKSRLTNLVGGTLV